MNDDQMLDTLRTRLTAKLAERAGIDPASVISLISALLGAFMGGCQAPTAAQVRQRGLGVRLRLNAIVGREFPEMRRRERLALADDVLAVAAEAEEAEVASFMTYVTGG